MSHSAMFELVLVLLTGLICCNTCRLGRLPVPCSAILWLTWEWDPQNRGMARTQEATHLPVAECRTALVSHGICAAGATGTTARSSPVSTCSSLGFPVRLS